MSSVFAQRRQKLLSLKALRGSSPAPAHTEETCPACGGAFRRRDLVMNRYVCPLCGHHYPIGAYYRLSLVLDKGTFRELDAALSSNDPLSFPGYSAKLEGARRRTGMSEGVVTATGRIHGQKVAIGALDSRFFMGSMSAALGEKVTRLVEYAEKYKLPLILFSASGGARMQEGILSLMQKAKTSAALERPALPPWGTSCWPSRGPLSALPAPGSLSRPSARSCPRASRAPSTCWNTAFWTPSSPAPSCGTP